MSYLTHFAIFPVKALTKQEGLKCLLGSSKNDPSFLKIDTYALLGKENLANCLLKTNWLMKLHLVKVSNFKKDHHFWCIPTNVWPLLLRALVNRILIYPYWRVWHFGQIKIHRSACKGCNRSQMLQFWWSRLYVILWVFLGCTQCTQFSSKNNAWKCFSIIGTFLETLFIIFISMY